MLRTRSPRARLYCYRLRVRLACVKHAASVRSEPGSNSRLKPDVPAVKPICIDSHDRERTVKSLGFLNSPPPGYTPEEGRNQTGSGLYHPIVKELVLPGRQEELRTNPDYTRAPRRSQGRLTELL